MAYGRAATRDSALSEAEFRSDMTNFWSVRDRHRLYGTRVYGYWPPLTGGNILTRTAGFFSLTKSRMGNFLRREMNLVRLSIRAVVTIGERPGPQRPKCSLPSTSCCATSPPDVFALVKPSECSACLLCYSILATRYCVCQL